MAWAMGAHPKNFPELPYSQEEMQVVAEMENSLKESPDDASVLTRYGMFLSQHNRLDEAQKHLEQAIKTGGGSLAAVWHGSNRLKQARAAVDVTFGMYKLWQVSQGEKEINQAVGKEPDNIEVRVVRLHTFAAIGSRVSTFNKLCGEEKNLTAWLADESLKSHAAMALANYYSRRPSCVEKIESLDKARYFLSQTKNEDSMLKASITDRIVQEEK